MRQAFQNLVLIISSIIIGATLGVVVGLICWLRFPFQIYTQAKINLAENRIRKAREQLKEYGKEDIWEKHLQRMEEKKEL
tara:strand:+ start:4217 stop:4456 length:240 start_codon:yes stop_codon:yes gene_type:complete